MPARSCVAAKQLPKGALVEIECVAVKWRKARFFCQNRDFNA
jgi:hypothetical protein